MARCFGSRGDSDSSERPLDENSELLPNSNKNDLVKATPLPLLQILILAAVRLAEPICYTQIFPYVNEMMERMHVTDDPANIGYYSGLVDSCFAIAQVMTVYQWSKWSDHIGRKPVLIAGLIGVALSSFCFGLSKSLVTAIMFRSIAGMFSGNVAVASSMLSEITDSTNQGKGFVTDFVRSSSVAFPLLGVIWPIGCIVGPMIGGDLSYPAERYPRIFGDSQLLRDYPYFLPCAVSAFITFSSILLCLFFVNETLPRIVEARKAEASKSLYGTFIPKDGSVPSTPTIFSRPQSPTPSDADTLAESPSDPSTPVRGPSPTPVTEIRNNNRVNVVSLREMISYPTVCSILLSSFMLSFLSMSFEIVFVLFSYTKVELGGIGRSPQQIGLAMSASGIASGCGSLFIFPKLQRTFNNRKMYTVLMSMWILTFLFAPIGSAIVRSSNGHATVAWLGVAFILVPVRVAGLNFPLNAILVKSSAPSKEVVGAMFGLQQTMSAFARAVSPTFISSLYAFSLDHREIAHGNLVWFVMIVLATYGVYVSSRVSDVGPAPTGNSAILTEALDEAEV